MPKKKTQAEWEQYLQDLRKQHARKIHLMEVLDGKPIIKTRCR